MLLFLFQIPFEMYRPPPRLQGIPTWIESFVPTNLSVRKLGNHINMRTMWRMWMWTFRFLNWMYKLISIVMESWSYTYHRLHLSKDAAEPGHSTTTREMRPATMPLVTWAKWDPGKESHKNWGIPQQFTYNKKGRKGKTKLTLLWFTVIRSLIWCFHGTKAIQNIGVPLLCVCVSLQGLCSVVWKDLHPPRDCHFSDGKVQPQRCKVA